MARKKHPSRLYWSITIGFTLIVVVVVFFENEAFYREFLAISARPAPAPGFTASARLTIDFGDGTKRAFEGQADNLTILSALRVSQQAGKFDVRTDRQGAVTAIAGVENSGLRRWQAYRNGRALDDMPGHVEVQAGDRVTFRYE